MAVNLEVNPNTVMRAYAYLQEKEIIYNKRGIGYFVGEKAYEATRMLMKSSFITNDLPHVYRTMALLNMDFDEFKTLHKDFLEKKE
jgi:DNA-binding transcriptional regulator YhcF (GntR family)